MKKEIGKKCATIENIFLISNKCLTKKRIGFCSSRQFSSVYTKIQNPEPDRDWERDQDQTRPNHTAPHHRGSRATNHNQPTTHPARRTHLINANANSNAENLYKSSAESMRSLSFFSLALALFQSLTTRSVCLSQSASRTLHRTFSFCFCHWPVVVLKDSK